MNNASHHYSVEATGPTIAIYVSTPKAGNIGPRNIQIVSGDNPATLHEANRLVELANFAVALLPHLEKIAAISEELEKVMEAPSAITAILRKHPSN